MLLEKDLLAKKDISFASDLNGFFLKRQEAFVECEVSEEYAQAADEIEKIYRRLLIKLDQQGKEELSNLSDTYGKLGMISKDLTYQQGFRDGFRFLYQMLNGNVM